MKTITKITWKFGFPTAKLKCFVCKIEDVEYKLSLKLNSATVTLCTCEKCLQLEEREIIEKLTTRKIK